MLIIKRKMDWKGLRVRSLIDMRNGWGKIPANTFFTVEYWAKGLALLADPCTCCGLKSFIGAVPLHKIELLDIEFNKTRLAYNKKCGYRNTSGRWGRYLHEPDEDKPVYEHPDVTQFAAVVNSPDGNELLSIQTKPETAIKIKGLHVDVAILAKALQQIDLADICNISTTGKHEYVPAPDPFDDPYCKHCYKT